MAKAKAKAKDKSLDDLHKSVNSTRERLILADEHMKSIGEGAEKVGLSITGATLELNALMKQLFLCAHHNLNEYDILHEQLNTHLNNIALLANTRFGRLPKREGEHDAETASS